MPDGFSAAPSGPRVTNLIPQVRPDDEHTTKHPTGRPRATAGPRLTNIPRIVADTDETTLQQTAGRLNAATSAPPIPNALDAPTKKTGAPRIGKTLPPETLVLPALSESSEAPGPESDPGASGGHIRGR